MAKQTATKSEPPKARPAATRPPRPAAPTPPAAINPNVNYDEAREVAKCLADYLGWYFKHSVGAQHLAGSQALWNEERHVEAKAVERAEQGGENPSLISRMPEVPRFIAQVNEVLASLAKFSEEGGDARQVRWDHAMNAMRAEGLSFVQAFHPDYADDRTRPHTLDEPQDSEKLSTHPVVSRRASVFDTLARSAEPLPTP